MTNEIDNFKRFLENEEYESMEDYLHDNEESFMDNETTEFCLQMLRMAMNAHLWHLQTKSYSEHEALEEFYTGLTEHADTLIEICISLKGSLNDEIEYNMTLVPFEEMEDELEAFKDLVEDFDDHIDEDSAENIMDDILTLTQKTLYKIRELE